MSELIEMPYGNGKSLALEFINVEMKRKPCFENLHCTFDCPNFQIDIANERYGYGIADDMGLEKISCKQCRYNTGRCEDCLFVNSKDCPEYKEVEDNDSIL